MSQVLHRIRPIENVSYEALLLSSRLLALMQSDEEKGEDYFAAKKTAECLLRDLERESAHLGLMKQIADDIISMMKEAEDL